jgi:transcriptional regulator with XRE-family HTH domain
VVKDGNLYSALLRHWRTRRGLSQLDLAVASGVSSRHVSFLETGRAQPSREMVLRLAATLDVPLRDQNELLRAAGFEAEFGEPDPATELAAPIARALDRMFAVHDPFPITLLDRRYDVLRVNDTGLRILMRFIREPAALPSRMNPFALLFDPRLARAFVVDWEHVASALVARLHRETLTHSRRPELAALLRSLFEYPDVPERWREPNLASPSGATLSFRLRRDDLELAFLTTITAFNAPQNVTLEELRIESYYPLDDATAAACERIAMEE